MVSKTSRTHSPREQVCQAHDTRDNIGREGRFDAQTDSTPASSSSALHDAASSPAEEASVTGVISDSGAAGTAPGDDVVPTYTSDAPSTQADDPSAVTGGRADVSPQTTDASLSTQHQGAVDMHLGEPVSQMASADAQADSTASSALDASTMGDMSQEWWGLSGPDAESIPEHQLQCIVQGMRLLVTLLRDNHTWEPV